jgi:hypothetical protein
LTISDEIDPILMCSKYLDYIPACHQKLDK